MIKRYSAFINEKYYSGDGGENITRLKLYTNTPLSQGNIWKSDYHIWADENTKITDIVVGDMSQCWPKRKADTNYFYAPISGGNIDTLTYYSPVGFSGRDYVFKMDPKELLYYFNKKMKTDYTKIEYDM